jgi:hypothetical protein
MGCPARSAANACQTCARITAFATAMARRNRIAPTASSDPANAIVVAGSAAQASNTTLE